MVEVREVKTRKEKREFIDFPTWLYRKNKCYVPPLYMDEKKIFRKDYVYYDTCEAVYYNAYKDGKICGRISGIIQRASNAKTAENRVRFTRFDVINDFEVAEALFQSVEEWAKKKGMDKVCGPLGFSDLEREGMLIDGFDQMSTFEEQYNAEYYPEFMEKLGYSKEVDWLEFRIFSPEPEMEAEMKKMSDFIMKRYHLHFGEAKNASDFLKKYADGFFDILDKSYDDIYGTVPITPGMKKLLMDNFKLIIDVNHVAVILDENNKVVLLAICFPSIAKAMQVAGGRLTPRAILKVLKALKRPEVVDLGLIGVEPSWVNKGISVCIAYELVKMLKIQGTEYAESNLNLEDNFAIMNLWKRFNSVQHKKRRSYLKQL